MGVERRRDCSTSASEDHGVSEVIQRPFVMPLDMSPCHDQADHQHDLNAILIVIFLLSLTHQIVHEQLTSNPIQLWPRKERQNSDTSSTKRVPMSPFLMIHPASRLPCRQAIPRLPLRTSPETSSHAPNYDNHIRIPDSQRVAWIASALIKAFLQPQRPLPSRRRPEDGKTYPRPAPANCNT
jgi:hypothetical protein